MTIKTKITPLGAGNKVFYAVGQVLFESGVPGTYSLEVLTKVFAIYGSAAAVAVVQMVPVERELLFTFKASCCRALMS